MGRRARWLGLLIVLCGVGEGAGEGVWATTFTCGSVGVANSCTPAGLASQIFSSVHGDTIIIATATHAWTSSVPVTVNKRITIDGGGTCTGCGTASASWSGGATLTHATNQAFVINVPAGGTGRATIRGIRFSGAPTWTYVFADSPTQGLTIRANSTNVGGWIVAHNHFDSTSDSGGVVANSPGLIHNNKFNLISQGGHTNGVYGWGASGNGDETWAAAVGFGTESTFVFFEDNTFIRPQAPASGVFENSFVDAILGGKYVFRHNYALNGDILDHDKSGGGFTRGGAQAMEIYNNEFLWQDADRYFTAILLRDGTALVYNNVINGFQAWVKTDNAREHGAQGNWGLCDGTHAWDGNLDGGGHIGAYPCLDQFGRGQAASVNHDLAQPQTLAPVRFWSNTGDFSGGCGGVAEQGGRLCNGATGSIIAGTDYRWSLDASEALPGYTAFTYPHPWRGGTDLPPAAPTGLTIAMLSLIWMGGLSGALFLLWWSAVARRSASTPAPHEKKEVVRES